MALFGRRKDGQAYPKNKKKGTKRKGAIKSSGKKIKSRNKKQRAIHIGLFQWRDLQDILRERKKNFTKEWGKNLKWKTEEIPPNSVRITGKVNGKIVDQITIKPSKGLMELTVHVSDHKTKRFIITGTEKDNSGDTGTFPIFARTKKDALKKAKKENPNLKNLKIRKQ